VSVRWTLGGTPPYSTYNNIDDHNGYSTNQGQHVPFILHLRRPNRPRLPIYSTGGARRRRHQTSARSGVAAARLIELGKTGGIETAPFLTRRLTIRGRKLLCYLRRVRERDAAGGIATAQGVWFWREHVDGAGARPWWWPDGRIIRWDRVRGFRFEGARGRRGGKGRSSDIFQWLDKFGDGGGVGIISGRVSYGGRVSETRKRKVFFKFIPIKPWGDGKVKFSLES